MTDKWDGFAGALIVGDHVRIVSSVKIDEVGIISVVCGMEHGGVGRHRITKKLVTFTETLYKLEDTGKVIFERAALYKLPPDFFTVTNAETAQRIKKLLLTSDET